MLLRPIDGPGWPRDYLLARVHGYLPQAAAPGGDPWPLLAAARRLYPVLDPHWRHEFAPVLGLLEIRALATALRLRRSGDLTRAAVPLRGSLLHPDLLHAGDPAQLCGRLELPTTADIRTLEATLFDRELARGRTLCREPALHLLLERLIDLRNLLALHKAWRWGVSDLPPFLAGGAIAVPRWEKLWRSGSVTELQHLVDQLAPRTTGEAPTRMLDDLGRRLQRRARDPLDAAVLLCYGWHLRQPAAARVEAA